VTRAGDAFRAGRARVLESFLARPALFSTPWFPERLEERAPGAL
jgi:predicted metal-dependent HD superfamily phosphohydrolase